MQQEILLKAQKRKLRKGRHLSLRGPAGFSPPRQTRRPSPNYNALSSTNAHKDYKDVFLSVSTSELVLNHHQHYVLSVSNAELILHHQQHYLPSCPSQRQLREKPQVKHYPLLMRFTTCSA